MRVARAFVWFLLALMAGLAPAWAQDTQTAPPPPMTAGQNRGYRAGRGGQTFVWRERGAMGPGRGMMAGGRAMGPGGGRFFARFRGAGGMRGMGFGAGLGISSGIARMVNNANLRQQLGITDAQAAKIRQQTTDFQVAQIRSRADLQVDQLQLRTLLTAQNPDSAAINQKLDQIGAVQLAERKQEVTYYLAMRDALTPEQRQKLQQLRRAPIRRGMRRTAPAPSATPPPPPGPPNP
jgi:Spy/CpxP family protein refolding chaperone